MSKRAYPFDESYSTQHKIFVGQKQVNEGVMKTKNMERVYDSTLKKLFSGMKSIKSPNMKFENVTNCNTFKEQNGSKHIALKQLEINLQGKLSTSIENAKISPIVTIPEPGAGFCKDCNSSMKKDILLSCSYCDDLLCEKCLKLCFKCLASFCSMCSFNEYKENVEKNVCLSCS